MEVTPLDQVVDSLIANSPFNIPLVLGQRQKIRQCISRAVKRDSRGEPFNYKNNSTEPKYYSPLDEILRRARWGDVEDMVWDCGHFLHTTHMNLKGNRQRNYQPLHALTDEDKSLSREYLWAPGYDGVRRCAEVEGRVPTVLAALLVASTNQVLKDKFPFYGVANPTPEFPAIRSYLRGLLNVDGGVFAEDLLPVFEHYAQQCAKAAHPPHVS